MPSILPHITFETAPSPRYSIIWLHGLGADGSDFLPIAEELNLADAVRYIFPHAPQRPVTLNGGYIMRAWYDLLESDLASEPNAAAIIKQDAHGIRASQAAVEQLIAQELQRGITADHIFLAGFSQGGVIALQTGLRYSTPLAGIIALSTYLGLADSLEREASVAARYTPILMAHGRDDTVVPYSLGVASREILLRYGCQLEWREYAMQHSVCSQEIRDLEDWLNQRIESVSGGC